MSRDDDFFTASEMSAWLTRIELGEVDFFIGVQKLNGCIQQLTSIPAAWKDRLLELSQEMELCADDEAAIAVLMERIEKAIDLIQDED